MNAGGESQQKSNWGGRRRREGEGVNEMAGGGGMKAKRHGLAIHPVTPGVPYNPKKENQVITIHHSRYFQFMHCSVPFVSFIASLCVFKHTL